MYDPSMQIFFVRTKFHRNVFKKIIYLLVTKMIHSMHDPRTILVFLDKGYEYGNKNLI